MQEALVMQWLNVVFLSYTMMLDSYFPQLVHFVVRTFNLLNLSDSNHIKLKWSIASSRVIIPVF